MLSPAVLSEKGYPVQGTGMLIRAGRLWSISSAASCGGCRISSRRISIGTSRAPPNSLSLDLLGPR
eukprot:241363-Pyramimonas_sp.AAC.1